MSQFLRKQEMMHCYKELHLEGYENSIDELLPKITSLFEESKDFYNIIDLDWFLFNCPKKLLNQLKDIGGEIFRPIVLKVSNNNPQKTNSNSIHVDGGIVDYRLNLPLLNSDSVETRFYQIIIDNPNAKIVNNYGSVANFYKEEDLELIDRLVITKPVIFPVKIPHGLFVIKPRFPRYMLTIQFESDTKLKRYLT